MTVSTSTDFTLTRDQIISTALTKLGVYRPGATVSSADYTYAAIELNSLVKSWEGQGIHMWASKEGTLFLRTNVNTYTLSTSSSDQAGDDVVETTLTAAASSTALTVSSTVGMTAADVIGIELDDGTRQWTTIVSVDSSTALTITTGVTSAASSGNTVFTYATHCGKLLHVSGVRFRNSDGTDRPVFIRGREEFMNIPNKTITGKINQVFYNPNLANGTMYVWPTPDSVADRLKFSYIRMLGDFDASSDNADLPTEWLYTLTCNLAVNLAGTYGKKLQQENPYLIQEAQQSLMQMQMWDSTQGSTRIVPNYMDN